MSDLIPWLGWWRSCSLRENLLGQFQAWTLPHCYGRDIWVSFKTIWEWNSGLLCWSSNSLDLSIHSRYFCWHGRDVSRGYYSWKQSANRNPRYLISLTLGVKSNQPCPICCVPKDYLESIGTKFPLRSSSECKEAVTSALQAKTAAEGDRICHSLGVCKIKVLCYWLFPMSLLTWL